MKSAKWKLPIWGITRMATTIQHMIYLYNYAGQPWKAQYWLRQVMDKMYTPGPDGYCGDEDNGQTSAWYVFSALGFYPRMSGNRRIRRWSSSF